MEGLICKDACVIAHQSGGHDLHISRPGNCDGKYANNMGHRGVQRCSDSTILDKVSSAVANPGPMRNKNMYLNRIIEDRKKAEITPDMSDILSNIQCKARDHARTPMQWNETSPSAGFSSSSKTWMRVNDDYKSWNVASQAGDPQSVHSFWKRALRIRKIHPVLVFSLSRTFSM